MTKPILVVRDLSVKAGDTTLVDQLSFEISKGKTLGIVGESGSGKSLTSLAIMGLHSKALKASGEILYKEKNMLKLKESEFQKIRGNEIAMIFQEPMTALNPTMKCGQQVVEMLLTHSSISKKKGHDEVIELFKKVELPRPGIIFESYPHEISGGQKQRVMIAMAIACKPKILIADEPTTALDATVQGGILKLLNTLRDEYGMGMIFISHDLAVVRNVADDILVMYKGQTMEYGPSEKIFNSPESAYTRGLLACRPTPQTSFERLPVVGDFLNGVRPKLKFRSREGREKRQSELQEKPPLLKVDGLEKIYGGIKGIFSKSDEVVALKSIQLSIYEGESLGLVGESGSGKTTLGRILSGLEKASAGSVFYRDKDITSLKRSGWRELHREVQIIFQDPFSSLNPRIKTGKMLMEVMKVQTDWSRKKRKEQSLLLLEKVGLGPEHFNRYPHEFSGGQRQRLGIARALAVNPRFIVCDESVSALDVSVQAQILNLLNDLKDEFGFTYLFISHDLAVVKYFAGRIIVLKDGQLVEEGLADDLYENPKTDYTKKLIASTFE